MAPPNPADHFASPVSNLRPRPRARKQKTSKMTEINAAKDVAHLPVMAQTCVDLLAPALEGKPQPVLVDATLGVGGHSEKLLQAFPTLQLIGIDRDPQARALAAKRLEEFAPRVEIVAATYGQLPQILSQRGLEQVDAILADLGVSSLQLDQAQRGFSYAQAQAPLDMRMNLDSGQTAADFLNSAPAEEISRVLREYGEEKFAWPLAKRIVRTRENRGPLQTAGELVELIKETIPAPARRSGGNPSKRTFQALRVYVNNELGDLAAFLPAALQALRVGGRLVVESYQSLEDRLVKRSFAAGVHPEVPKEVPLPGPEYDPWLRDLTRGALRATETEIRANPRSQSVRIRAVEKLRQPQKSVK